MKQFQRVGGMVLSTGLWVTAAAGQAVLPVTSIDLVAGIDLADDGVSNSSFTAGDLYRLGLGLSLDGDTIVFGNSIRSDNDNPSLHRGHIVTMLRDSVDPSVWGVASYDTHDDPVHGSLLEVKDEYGHDVVVNGAAMFVGSRRFDTYDLSVTPPVVIEDDPGAVFVYVRPPAQPANWIQFQVIDNPTPVEGERFGHSLGYDAGTLVVAAQRGYVGDADPFDYCGIMGEIHIYEPTGANSEFELQETFTWDDVRGYRSRDEPIDNPLECTIVVPPIPDNDRGRGNDFGKDVTVEGDWVVASSPVHNAVAVFHRDSEGVWAFHSFLAASGSGSNSGEWGTSVSMSSGRIAVGAKKYPIGTPAYQDGLVSLFEYDATNDEWVNTDNVNVGQLAINIKNARFGRSVHLDGDLLVVSCQGNGNVSLFTPGAGDVAELYSFLIDPSDGTLVPQGRVYYNGDGNGYRKQDDALGIAYDRESGMVAAGDVGPLGSGKLRMFPACAADLNGDLVVDAADSTLFTTLYAASDTRVDFAAPFGVFDFYDVQGFVALAQLGCP